MRKFIRLADVNLTTLTAVDVDVNVNVHPFGCCCLDDVDVTDLTTSGRECSFGRWIVCSGGGCLADVDVTGLTESGVGVPVLRADTLKLTRPALGSEWMSDGERNLT